MECLLYYVSTLISDVENSVWIGWGLWVYLVGVFDCRRDGCGFDFLLRNYYLLKRSAALLIVERGEGNTPLLTLPYTEYIYEDVDDTGKNRG